MAEWIIVFLLVLAFGVVVGVLVASRRKGFASADHSFFAHQWAKVLAEMESHPAQAVLSADKLLDLALKKQGKQGTLGEKLQRHGALFSNLDGIWASHKLRNTIAHEVGFVPSLPRAREALGHFRRGLCDLGLHLDL